MFAFASIADASSQTLTGGSTTSQVESLAQKSVTVTATVLFPDGVSGSKCVDSIFDWAITNGDHYDVRLVRVCQNVSYSWNAWTNDWSTRSPTGVNKAGGCKVTGVNIYSLAGNRSGCVNSASNSVETADTCGGTAAACRLRSGGSAFSVCMTTPTNALTC